MSIERELLKKILATRWLDHELSCEVEAILAQPEQEGVYQKILRIEEGIEVEILPSKPKQPEFKYSSPKVCPNKMRNGSCTLPDPLCGYPYCEK